MSQRGITAVSNNDPSGQGQKWRTLCNFFLLCLCFNACGPLWFRSRMVPQNVLRIDKGLLFVATCVCSHVEKRFENTGLKGIVAPI